MSAKNANIDALKLRIMKDVLEIEDIGLLQKIASMVPDLAALKGNQLEGLLGYNLDGSPLTVDQLMEIAKKVELERVAGTLMTIDEYERTSKSS